MIKQDKIIGLLKFGLRSHMEELLHDGHLFMSPLSTFINMEDDHLRSDQDEAVDYSMPAKGAGEQVGKWESENPPVGAAHLSLSHLPTLPLSRSRAHATLPTPE